MKLPERPPNWNSTLREQRDEVLKAWGDPAYTEFVQKLDRYYVPWDKFRFKATHSGLNPELAWVIAKFGRLARMRELPLRGFSRNLQYSIPDLVQRELMIIDQELAGRLSAEIEQPFTPSQRERFIINALHEEAIASSMLEGAATTREEAKKMLRTQRTPKTHGEWMVLNNYQAILHVRENLDVDLTPEFLLELQTMLTENTVEKDRLDIIGRFRNKDEDIKVVDSRDNVTVHVPPDADELPRRMKELCEFANRSQHEDHFVHPVVKACILHFQLGFDHPFCDGNGRTARAVFYWSLLRDGYWLFEFLPISRLIYVSPISYSRAYAFTETDEFDVTYFLMYKLRIISLARQELRQYLQVKQRELRQAQTWFGSDDSVNHRQREVVMQFVRDPERQLTIQEHQNRFQIVYETARQDLLELEDAGYLEKTKVGKQYHFRRGSRIEALYAKKSKRSIRSTIPRLR